jgi:hypothetical protein
LSYPDITQQTIGEPLANPWFTPGWTSQKPLYQLVPQTPFTIQGYPAAAVYVTVAGNYFDPDGNPLSGYLTFWPSDDLLLDVSGVITRISRRFSGTNLWDVPGALWGSGRMYLKNGKLLVSLLATDNLPAGVIPSSFTYRVEEHFLGGRKYDISVPSASVNPVDINNLIITEFG